MSPNRFSSFLHSSQKKIPEVLSSSKPTKNQLVCLRLTHTFLSYLYLGNSTSVEFWDMKTDTWLDLPSLSRGRRSHSMTTIQGKMAVAGGVGTNRRGEDEFLDDVEIFDGKRWRRASSGLDQPRQGANLVKIPYTRFRG